MFVGGDPTRPNDEYFQQLDYVVRKAGSLGLYVALVPLWSNAYEKPERHVLNPETAFGYGKFLGTRYRDPAVIWIPWGRWLATGFEDIWRQMAAGIAAGDGGVHLKTYHPKSPRSSAQWFHQEVWLDFNMLQTGHTTLNRNYDLVAEDWARVPVKPVVDGEGGYEGIADAFVPEAGSRRAMCGASRTARSSPEPRATLMERTACGATAAPAAGAAAMRRDTVPHHPSTKLCNCPPGPRCDICGR